MKKDKTFITLLGFFAFILGCSTPLKSYVPASEKEAEIKNLLLTYEDCWNSKNAECLKRLTTEDAEIMVPSRREKKFISVKEASDDFLPTHFDKYGTGKYHLVKIEVKEDTGHAIVYFQLSKLPLILPEVHLILVRAKGKWLIKRQYHVDVFSDAVPRYSFFGIDETLSH